MNLPVNEVVLKCIATQQFDFKKKINELFDQNFVGYVVVTIFGHEGVEEGVLIFKSGLICAAIYDFLNYDISIFGQEALPYVFNAFLCKEGVVDIYGLTKQQVDLVIAFNDKIELSSKVSKKDIGKFFSPQYSEELSKNYLSRFIEKQKTKEEVLKKLGLESLG